MAERGEEDVKRNNNPNTFLTTACFLLCCFYWDSD